jgi:hypothetical protein
MTSEEFDKLWNQYGGNGTANVGTNNMMNNTVPAKPSPQKSLNTFYNSIYTAKRLKLNSDDFLNYLGQEQSKLEEFGKQGGNWKRGEKPTIEFYDYLKQKHPTHYSKYYSDVEDEGTGLGMAARLLGQESIGDLIDTKKDVKEAEALLAKATQLRSRTFLYDTGGEREIKDAVLKASKVMGLNVQEHKNGKLYAIIDNKQYELNGKTANNIWSMAKANGYTMGGDMIGGLGGAWAGAKFGLKKGDPRRAAFGALAGGTFGSMAGAGLGSLQDTTESALATLDNISEGDKWSKAADEAATAGAFGVGMPILGKLGKKGLSITKNTIVDAADSLIDWLRKSPSQKSAEKLGYDGASAKGLARALKKFLPAPKTNSFNVDLANAARGNTNLANLILKGLNKDPELAYKFSKQVSARDTKLLADLAKKGASPEEMKQLVEDIGKRAGDVFEETTNTIASRHPVLWFTKGDSSTLKLLSKQSLTDNVLSSPNKVKKIINDMEAMSLKGRLTFSEIVKARSFISQTLSEETTFAGKSRMKELLDTFDEDIVKMVGEEDAGLYRRALDIVKSSKEPNSLIDSIISRAATDTTVEGAVSRNILSVNDNINKIVSKLPLEKQAKFEIGVLSTAAEKASQKFTSGRTSIKYDKLLENLKGVKFVTEEANNMRDVILESARLFRADNQLMNAAEHATYKNVPTGVGSNIIARAETETLGNRAYDFFRGVVPIIGGDIKLQKVLLKGLEQSTTIQEFAKFIKTNKVIPPTKGREIMRQLLQLTGDTSLEYNIKDI